MIEDEYSKKHGFVLTNEKRLTSSLMYSLKDKSGTFYDIAKIDGTWVYRVDNENWKLEPSPPHFRLMVRFNLSPEQLGVTRYAGRIRYEYFTSALSGARGGLRAKELRRQAPVVLPPIEEVARIGLNWGPPASGAKHEE